MRKESMCDCHHESLMEMYLANCRPSCAQCCAVLWVQWEWQTLHVFSRFWGNRLLNEDCHHCHPWNSAEVTWLSPRFYQCSQKQRVRNHSALETVVQVGEGHTLQHSHISPWKGTLQWKAPRTAHSRAGTESKQRFPAWRGWGDGAAATTPFSCL